MTGAGIEIEGARIGALRGANGMLACIVGSAGRPSVCTGVAVRGSDGGGNSGGFEESMGALIIGASLGGVRDASFSSLRVIGETPAGTDGGAIASDLPPQSGAWSQASCLT